ncbi:MAG TPA: site-2 protease family protein [Terriglobales bacterium]|nr:site-2 protease family protein [Terriglobales bacterium]
MAEFLTAVLAVAVVLGFMILIHEWGHYAAAKLLGVRVEVFSIGFGKRLLGFRRADTDYRISAIPLGGYVKMSGENPMDARTGDPAEFLSHPRWHRFVIALAGPAMNILLAIGLLTAVYMVHYEYPVFWDKPAVINFVRRGSPADEVGLQAGDRISRIDGIANPTWEQVFYKTWLNPNQPVDITIQRGDRSFNKLVVPNAAGESQIGFAGWSADESIIVGDMEPNMPAAKAGIREDDKIVALDGKPLQSIEDMIDRLQETKDKPIDLTVVRQGQTLQFHLQPVLASSEPAREPAHEQRYRIGFQNTIEMKVMQLPLPEAFKRSLDRNRKDSVMLVELVEKLVQRKISMRTISGPIGIAQQAGEAAEEKGWWPLLQLSAAVSLNLGVFNLLPIPILDGGVILLLLIEGLMRRDISLRIKERIYQAAFVFLVLFAVMLIYNDLAKTLPGLAGRLP